MDSLIAAAARALSTGDALGALQRVALREDPPALALRGIALAQLGEHGRARELLCLAARGFGSHEQVPRARCIVAEAEVALSVRDLTWSPRALESAILVLAAQGDRINAIYARLLSIRRLLLLGHLEQAEAAHAEIDTREIPASLYAVSELTKAEIALRFIQTERARRALSEAQRAAAHARIPQLIAEIEHAQKNLAQPAAKLLRNGSERTLTLAEVEAVLTSGEFILDACRHVVRTRGETISLATRPVLFSLARALCAASPSEVSREELAKQAFAVERMNDSHRVRLRVEIGRLRAALQSLASIQATKLGFSLTARAAGSIGVLLPPIAGEQGALLALLSDGEAWSTSALALALGASQRTVQRALLELEAAGNVQGIGRARSRRWLAPPLTGFATTLLLPRTLPVR